MDIKKDVQHQFGRNAEQYVKSKGHKEGKDLQKLLSMGNLTKDMIALDIATGGGHTANALASRVRRVTAFDLTPEMLTSAESFIKSNGHANVDFIQGDAEQLPFSKERFDVVTCRIAPHHFPDADKFTREVFRVLKNNGQFLLDDNVVPEDDELDYFYNKIEKDRDYSHYRAWKKTEWLKRLEVSGFTIIEWHRFEKTFNFADWCKRMKLSEKKTKALNDYILGSSAKVKQAFHIEITDGQVISFQGEAVLLKAVKP